MTLERLKRKWRLFITDKARWRRNFKLFSKILRRVIYGAVFIALGYLVHRYVPPQHLPWKPLNVEAPLGLSTKIQLMRVSLSPSNTCMSLARDAAKMQSIPAEPRDGQGPCGWTVARLMYGTDNVSFAPGETALQCPLALGQYMWLREVNKAALNHLGSGVAKLHHAGSYSCRRQRGNGSGAWSEHAFANALDVTGFTLKDGRVISVLRDWKGRDGADKAERRRFLKEARDQGCKIFRVTLSPDFNAAHHDHFHFDMGPSTSCR